MRQAIKGDGSDSTEELKAYLLEHDEVMSQELYEFTRPGIGVPLGQSEGALLMPTTLGEFVPSAGGGYPDYSDATASPSGGWLSRWHSSGVSDINAPGDLIFSFDPPGVYGAPGADSATRPRSDIERVKVALRAYSIPAYDPEFHSFFDAAYSYGISLDGGDTFPAMLGQGISPSSTVRDYSLDITSAIGDVSAFDFTQLRVKVAEGSSLFWNNAGIPPQPPGAQLFVSDIGVQIYYGRPYAEIAGASPVLLARVTDASSPLTYRNQVYSPAHVRNNGFKSKIGLDVDSLELEWKFRGDEAMITDPDTGATILTMLQGFKEGLWDGVWVKWLRTYMPTFGDCDSLGAVRMFRGRIAPVTVDRLTAKITVNSVTEMFNRQVPGQLIEANNRSLQVGPGLPPDLDPDPAHWTYFECVAGHDGTAQKIVARQTDPTADIVYAPGTYDLGYLLFQASPFENWVAQVQHYEVIAGFNVFYLFRPLYADPHVYGSRFAAFVPVPKDQTVSGANGVELPGFPRVPLPEQAV